MSQEKSLAPIKNLIESKRDHYADLLPSHVSPDVFIKSCVIAATQNPYLWGATQSSWLIATTKAAELGLDFTGAKGEGYLVPFNNRKEGTLEAQFMPGFKGLLNLARRSGDLRSIEARLVHEGDLFKVAMGTDSKIIHVPCMTGNKGAVSHVYAVAKLKDRDADPLFEVMDVAEINKIKNLSKASGKGPWVEHWGEMAKKTVIKRLLKLLPLSTELVHRAVEYDNEQFGGIPIRGQATVLQPNESKSDALLKQIQGDQPEHEPPEVIDTEAQSIPDAEPVTEPEAEPLTEKKKLIQQIEKIAADTQTEPLDLVKEWRDEDKDNRPLKRTLDKYTATELKTIYLWANTN